VVTTSLTKRSENPNANLRGREAVISYARFGIAEGAKERILYSAYHARIPPALEKHLGGKIPLYSARNDPNKTLSWPALYKYVPCLCLRITEAKKKKEKIA